jgi:hypothetical protein
MTAFAQTADGVERPSSGWQKSEFALWPYSDSDNFSISVHRYGHNYCRCCSFDLAVGDLQTTFHRFD